MLVQISNDGIAKALNNMAKKFPDEVNNFMKKESTGYQRAIGKAENNRWNTPSERTLKSKYANNWKSFKKARYKVWSELGGIKSWVALKDSKPHEHLLEKGHRVVSHGKDTGKRTTAYGFIEHGVEQYRPVYEEHAKELIERLSK